MSPIPPTRLQTRWAALVQPDSVLPDYPRPQMVRKQWTNLNGGREQLRLRLRAAVPPAGSATPVLRRGSNIIAVHVTQTLGGQFVDVGIVARERR